MNRPFVKRIHSVAGALALLIPLAYLTATLVVEVSGHAPAIAAVKRAIAWSLLLLLPVMMAAGLSGRRLSGRSRARVVLRKQRRMRLVAANGLLVLVPCAVALHVLAGSGDFGPIFYAVQAVEFLAGPVNIVLLGLNMRDGLRMSGRFAKPRPPAAAGRGRV